MKFEEIGPVVSKEKLFKGVLTMDDKWGVITIAHLEPSAQVS